ncbi:MAG TPA: DUF1156 domain-containing protein, partial [Alphaproteobacteria bacterium]|nr:DUF1156 domain-containing protein [Alphaproteobacteria bacterium]
MGETPYKKKLIEVALPLEAINAASAREKSIRHGLAIWLRPINRTIIFANLPRSLKQSTMLHTKNGLHGHLTSTFDHLGRFGNETQ